MYAVDTQVRRVADKAPVKANLAMFDGLTTAATGLKGDVGRLSAVAKALKVKADSVTANLKTVVDSMAPTKDQRAALLKSLEAVEAAVTVVKMEQKTSSEAVTEVLTMLVAVEGLSLGADSFDELRTAMSAARVSFDVTKTAVTSAEQELNALEAALQSLKTAIGLL